MDSRCRLSSIVILRGACMSTREQIRLTSLAACAG